MTIQDNSLRPVPPALRGRLLVGCCGLPGRRASTFGRLGAVELDWTFRDSPGTASLRRLRGQAPPGFAFVVRAGWRITHERCPSRSGRGPGPAGSPDETGVGHFRSSREVLDAWRRTRVAARTLGASGVLFETPSSFTPTAGNRLSISRFFEAVPRDMLLAWEPRGLWSHGEHLAVCKDLGLVPCLDPLAMGAFPEPGPVAYLRVHGMGSLGPVSGDRLRWLASNMAVLETCLCFMDTPRRLEDASRLAALLVELRVRGGSSGPPGL